jgi:hypothetical protein
MKPFSLKNPKLLDFFPGQGETHGSVAKDLTRLFEAMKKERLIGSPLDARTLATVGIALFAGYNMRHYIDNRIDIKEMLTIFVELLQIQKPRSHAIPYTIGEEDEH